MDIWVAGVLLRYHYPINKSNNIKNWNRSDPQYLHFSNTPVLHHSMYMGGFECPGGTHAGNELPKLWFHNLRFEVKKYAHLRI